MIIINLLKKIWNVEKTIEKFIQVFKKNMKTSTEKSLKVNSNSLNIVSQVTVHRSVRMYARRQSGRSCWQYEFFIQLIARTHFDSSTKLTNWNEMKNTDDVLDTV